MPPRRRAGAPPAFDVSAARVALAAGKSVRVRIPPSDQLPEGASGRVRSIGDPDADGRDYVQVELVVNGGRDVLPFAPGDLAPATRGRPAAAAAPVAPAAATPSRVSATMATPARLASAPAGGATGTPPGNAAGVESVAPSGVRGTSAPTDAPREAPPPTSRPRRRSGAVAIRVGTSDEDPATWRVEASIGARTVVRSSPISPARAWEFVQQLDNAALTEAVSGLLVEHRRITAAKAEALAGELARLQAELAELPVDPARGRAQRPD